MMGIELRDFPPGAGGMVGHGALRRDSPRPRAAGQSTIPPAIRAGTAQRAVLHHLRFTELSSGGSLTVSTRSDFDFSFTFTFRNRDQYLAFRRLWKENYTALSGVIRNHKKEIKSAMRKQEYAGPLQSKARGLKQDATIQLLMLQAAKQEANRQYLAARQMIQ